MGLIYVPKPWTEQPQGVVDVAPDVPLDVHVTYPVGSAWFNATTGAVARIDPDYIPRVSQVGTVWDAQIGQRTFLTAVTGSGPFYGALIQFSLTVAGITSTTLSFKVLATVPNASGGEGLSIGLSTSHLTNETVCLMDAGSNRSGTDAEIGLGNHTLCVQWDAATSRYEFWLDGVLPNQLHTVPPIGLQSSVIGTLFEGCGYDSEARICPSLIVVNRSPTFDLRKYQNEPWRLLAPRKTPIFYGGEAATAPTITALSARLITSTSAQPRISYS